MAAALLRMWAVLVLAGLCAARPQSEAKLITEPRPGEEFVLFQTALANHTARAFDKLEPHARPADGFSTSHKIPLQKALLDKKLEAMDFETAHRVPVHEDFSKRSAEGRAEVEAVPLEAVEARTSRPRKAADQPLVDVEPRGDTGVLEARPEGADEKKAVLKKPATALLKDPGEQDKQELLSSVEVKPVAQVGVTKPHFDARTGDISVPEMKQETVITSTASPARSEVTTSYFPLTSARPQEASFEVIPVNVIQTNSKEYLVGKSLDFVDSPLDDKLLVPAGSSANTQSRIEVKKGPNGEDYEYEYVYYYYDDDNDTLSDSAEKGAGPLEARNTIPKAVAPTTTSTTTTTTTTTTTSTTTEKPAGSKRYLPTSNLVRKEAEPHDEHGSSEKARGRGRNKNSAADPPRGEGRGRYTTIERHRGDATTTVIPEAVNEVIPARAGSRFRSRQPSPPAEEAEERLPANTRFPPRSRGVAAAPGGSTAPPPAAQERGRPATSSVRRPSLELVDSSSFRTHSSGASPDQDITAQTGYSRGHTPSLDDGETRPGRTRGQPTPAPDTDDPETEAAPRSRGPHIRRPTTGAPLLPEEELVVDVQTTRTVEEPAGTTEASGLAAAMDKAALELYAVLQQAQADNGSNLVDGEATERDEAATEEVPVTATPTTTAAPTTTPAPTTTTTTTTPAPTTTTTTTTTTTEAPAPPPGGRGRYRPRPGGSGGSSRNRFRSSPSTASTASTTEPAPAESSTRARSRFGGGPRTTSGGFGGRRKPVRHEEPSSEADSSEAPSSSSSSTARPSYSRGRFGGGRPSRNNGAAPTTEHPTGDASSSASSAASAATKPVFPERHSARRRPGLRPASTTAAPPSEGTRSEGDESEPATASEGPAQTTATLRPAPGSRPRISLSPGSARPLRPGPRINLAGRARPGAGPTTPLPPPPPPTPEAADAASAEQPAAPEDAAPETSEEAVTAAPDALTRLRNRPRLRVTERAPKATPAPVSGRRNLVSSLLPRRRPQQPPPPAETKEAGSAEDQPEAAEEGESAEEEEAAATAAPDPPQEGSRLSSLLAGRRRNNLPRRPGSLFPSSAGRAAPSSKEAA